jgi:hypothetical protein
MWQRRFRSLQLLPLLFAAKAPAVVWAQGSAAPPSSLMGRIRTFLGVQPRSVSMGGTRSSSAQNVCLLARGPIESGIDGPSVRVLGTQPSLVLGSKANEIELRRGELVLWSQLASSKTPIRGRLAWPLAPLKSGERLVLAMRPQGAAGGDWAVVSLEIASVEAQHHYATALRISGDSAERRLQLLDQAVTARDGPLAHALLWAPDTESSSSLTTLQRELQTSCNINPSTQ